MRNFVAHWLLVALTLSLPCVSLAEPAVLLRPAQVWTAGEPLHAGWVVLTQGERIAAVGPQSTVHVPQDALLVDLPGTTLLPGLMDAH
jgi:imidazolonepropionase-like amidohydrolase